MCLLGIDTDGLQGDLGTRRRLFRHPLHPLVASRLNVLTEGQDA